MTDPFAQLLAALTGGWPGPAALAFAGAATFAAAVLRGLTGFGFALAAVPLLSLVLSPAQAVQAAILLQVLVGLRDLIALRGIADWASLPRLSLGAALGTPAGVALLALLDPAVTRLAISAVVAAGLLFLVRPPGVPEPALRLALPAGALAGFFGGLAAMPGPPAVAYFLRSGAPPAVARASLMVFFFATSAFALLGFAAAGLLDAGAAGLAAVLLPPLMLGSRIGGRLFLRTSEAGYRRLAIGVLAAIACASAAGAALDLLR